MPLKSLKHVVLVRSAPSASAAQLAAFLGIRRMEPTSPYLPNKKIIINWGCTRELMTGAKVSLFNAPASVRIAADKRKCADVLEQSSIRTVNFCSGSYATVRAKYPEDILLARYTLTGHSGAGIEVFRKNDPAPQTEPVAYSVYVKKRAEFRVHVAFDKAIHVVEKRRREGVEMKGREALVRNLGDMWVFCEEKLSCDERGDRAALEKIAVDAVNSCGLHFGSVDVLYSHEDEYIVCEINTKTGIGTTRTRDAYVAAFKEAIANG